MRGSRWGSHDLNLRVHYCNWCQRKKMNSSCEGWHFDWGLGSRMAGFAGRSLTGSRLWQELEGSRRKMVQCWRRSFLMICYCGRSHFYAPSSGC